MTPSPSTEATTTTAQRIAWALLIAITLYVCYFSHLDVIGFVGPDEPRYAWIARDMAESGDWITPRLYGRPWFEKPPLLYWGGAIFFKILGEGRPEIAARLPSAISGILATLALAWLAWRTYGQECARWLLLLLPTSVGMIGFSHACATDMPFAGMLTIAMVCAVVILRLLPPTEDTPLLPREPWLALLLFGFFLGLAVLAKGPAAIVLSGGAVFFWALFTKRWRDAFRLLHPAAIAAFCMTALPWYILCARRNPDFFRIFIIEHNFKRYLTPEFQHIQPFWFYIPILVTAFLPWIALSPWAVYAAVSEYLKSKEVRPLTLLFLVYSISCLLFFSVSKSKLPGYILPAVPAIALLLARCVQSRGPSKTKSFRVFAAVGSLLFLLLSLLLLELSRLLAHSSHLKANAGQAYALFAACFAMANLLLIFTGWNRPGRSSMPLAMLAAVPVLVAAFFASYFADSTFGYDPSGKTLSEIIANSGPSPSNVFVGPMNRGKHYGLDFYLHKEIPDWDPAHPQTGVLVLRGRNCTTLVTAPYVCGSPQLLEKSGDFVYEISRSDSLDRDRNGRQPQ